MHPSRTTLAILTVAAALVGCERTPVDPGGQDDTRPAFAKGGIPGPPSWVIIPRAPGPPPRVPVPLPPKAGPPSFLVDVTEIGAGGRFGCALRSDGVVLCWGSNDAGQLGDGSQAPSSAPVEVSGPTRFAHLFVGDANVCGLTPVGEAWCWGDNSVGQLGTGQTGGLSSVAVPVSGGHAFRSLSIGLRTICGVATDGFTYCWGMSRFGQLGNGIVGGSSNMPVAVINSGSLGFVSVSVGYFHACALDGTGNAWCWGTSSYFGNGALGPAVPTPALAAGGAPLSAIGVGTLYTCALDPVGSASCWGTPNQSGELGTGYLAVPALAPGSVIGGLSFGSLATDAANSFLQSACGIATSGEAWCWGSNQYGQLGGSSAETCSFGSITYDCSSSPVQVTGGLTLRQLSVGLDHACGIDSNDAAWCWGANDMGQLGDGTMVNSAAPVQVMGLLAPQQLGSIVVTPPTASLRLLGSTTAFTAEALNESGTPLMNQPSFTWTSSDPTIARVDATGTVTALADGNVVITATAGGMSGRAVLDVRIMDPELTFRQAWSGGSADGVTALGGLLADEWVHSGTFPTRREVDLRNVALDNVTVGDEYWTLDSARIALEFEAGRLQSASSSNPRVSEMLTLAGYTYLAFAENFCSGVPLFDPDVGLTTNELLNLALAQFARAARGPIIPPYDVLAAVGTGRAYLGLGNFASAAAAVAGVPTGFVFNTMHTSNAGEGNGIYLLNPYGRRISLADAEGGNGLAFRRVPADPRVGWVYSGLGFGAVVPQYDLLKYPAVTSPIPIASGIEARLIEAEAALRANDVAGFLSLLDGLRAPTLPPVVDPGTAAGRVDLLFSERAFWLFATGTRLGDLRRRIAYYGGSEAALFPVGAHVTGATYGTDANLPVPQSARGASFSACTDRTH